MVGRRSGCWAAFLVCLLVPLVGYASTPNASVQPVDRAEKGTRYAVLIGVTEYTRQSGIDLVGPRNDALLMRQVLLDSNVPADHIHLLVDGETNAQEPTRENILATIAAVTEKAGPGDQVYLHFGGHGTQVPMLETADNFERDGLDELFLPKDILGWTRDNPTIDRAIRDDEIAEIVARIRKKGAFVWVVFDSCHSGTMTRGVVTMRSAKPSQLGVPEEVMEAARAKVRTRGNAQVEPEGGMLEAEGPSDQGGFVAFYAAQTDQETPEMPLPRRTKGAERHGLFSYHLASVLANSDGLTYRQVAQQILQNYEQQPWRATVPLFEGELDREVFGDAVSGQRQYKVSVKGEQIEIAGGTLHRLAPGTRLVVVPEPTSRDEQSMATVEIVTAEPLKSQARLVVPENDGTGPAASDIARTAYARVIQESFRIDVTYAVESLESLSDAEKSLVEAVLSSLRDAAEGESGRLAITEVAADAAPEIRLFGTKGDLYLLNDDEDYPCEAALMQCSGDQRIRQFVKLPISSRSQLLADLEATLLTIGRANNLRRLASAMGPARSQIAAQASYQRMAAGEPVGCDLPPGARVEQGNLPELGIGQLVDGDCLSLRFENTSRKDMDVYMLFIDGNYGVYPIFPQNNEVNRIKPGESLTWSSGVNSDSIGREQILVIALEASYGNAKPDFAFLAQAPLERSLQTRGGQAGRGGAAGQIEALFEQAAFGGATTRGLTATAPRAPVEMSGVQVISWETAPRHSNAAQ